MNTKAIEIIKKWEGCKLDAYKCSAGVTTIGYGHTKTAKPNMSISQDVAESLLQDDLEFFERSVKALTKDVELNNNQLAALISFAFNLGVMKLKNSTLLKIIKANPNNIPEIEKQFLRWVYVGKTKLKGLENRRKDEVKLYKSEV